MWRLAFLTILLSMLVIAGCDEEEAATPQVQPGEEFVLALGESVEVSGEDMMISFVTVVSDNRCPEDAQCIVAGEAVCLIEIDRGGVTEPVTLIEPGLSEQQTQEFLEYEITFDVEPYPQAGEDILPADYRLHLAIEAA